MSEDFKLTSNLTLGREYKCYFRTKLCNVDRCKAESKPNVIISYYCLPSNPDMAQKWLEALNLMEVPYNFIVCSAHFTEDDFSATLKSEHMTYRVLKSTAIPNKNLPRAMNPQYHVPVLDPNSVVTLRKGTVNNETKQGTLMNKIKVKKIKPIYIKMKEENQNGESDVVNTNLQDQQFVIQYDDTQDAVSSIIGTEMEQNETVVDIENIKQEFVQEVANTIICSSEAKNKRAKAALGRNKRLKTEEDLENFNEKVLTIVEQVAEIKKRASSSNYMNAAYKCDLCYKGYMTENTYNSHMAKHGEENGLYDCIVCHCRFKTVHNLKQHMTKHSLRYTCQKCQFDTCKRTDAETHSKNCQMDVRFPCDLCSVEFESITSLLSHVRELHPSIHVCEVCGFSFIGVKGLNHHTRLKHPQHTL